MIKRILSSLPDTYPWRDRILWLESIDSTNTEAKLRAKDGAPHGTVILARSQTGGRGRMGRSFYSPSEKGLYLSMILRPECAASALLHLTCAAAVAACEAVSSCCDVTPQVKWTNDLVVGKKKLGGILTEMSLYPGSAAVEYAVIGIGINVQHLQEDFPPQLQNIATSLRLAGTNAPETETLIAALLMALEKVSCELLTSKHSIMDRYRNLCMTTGQKICLLRGEDTFYGTALQIDDDGGLVVQFTDGSCKTVTSGEVSVRGMYGYV